MGVTAQSSSCILAIGKYYAMLCSHIVCFMRAGTRSVAGDTFVFQQDNATPAHGARETAVQRQTRDPKRRRS